MVYCVCVYCIYVGNKSEINDMYIIFFGVIGEKFRYFLNISNLGRIMCYLFRFCESYLIKIIEGLFLERKFVFFYCNKFCKLFVDLSLLIFVLRNKL